jgi:hypothetical protein
MKIKNFHYALAMTVIAGMLASCSSSNQFASSFGKRKYTKGYYVDAPSSIKESVSSNKTAVIAKNSDLAVKENVVTTKTVTSAPVNAIQAKASSVVLAKNTVKSASKVNASISKNAAAGVNNAVTKSVSSTVPEIVATPIVNQTEATQGHGGGGSRSWVIALVLCFFVGMLGIHRFYLGYIGLGILELLTAGCFGILWLIDFIRIIIRSLNPKDGSYSD